MEKKFVLFDFDGVIADSFAVASALAKRVCKENTPERYRSAFEGNIYDSIEIEKPGGKRPDHGDDCAHDLDWWDEYEKAFTTVHPFDGIPAVLKQLHESYRFIIVTSGHRKFIEPFLSAHGLLGLFEDILDVDVHTHKTKKIEMIFNKYGITASDCVFVTDTLGDLREAAHHSMGTIACSWGFHSHETLSQGLPFRIVDSPKEIPDAVGDYFAASYAGT